MEKVRYMISDASNLIQVEAHVLRYWEEELDLDVPRNEMGHRYYTEENIRQFEQIRKLKEEGFQLKAIKMLIHSASGGIEKLPERQESLHRETSAAVREDAATVSAAAREDVTTASVTAREDFMQAPSAAPGVGTQTISSVSQDTEQTVAAGQKEALSKLEQFRMMMDEIVRGAIAENNQALGLEVGTQVRDIVIKEMNYLMRDREEQEEERFRKLDETIRSHMKQPKKEKRTFFRTPIHKANEMS
ncbi:MAG: MerR family transcriptional regulator [Clostridiales bacterium]|nr:MerR family transcriptional regulator [Clostridiales bacterium]